MKIQTFYAVVQNNALKYRNQLRCPTLSAQLPIYWLQKVAKQHCPENCTVVKVRLVSTEELLELENGK